MLNHKSLFISCMNIQCVQIYTFLFSLHMFCICSKQHEIIGVVKQAGLINVFIFSFFFTHWGKGFIKLPAFICVSKMKMCKNRLQDTMKLYNDSLQIAKSLLLF